MTNLGIGVEESSEAIKTLNKNLEGLPTTLNEGASAVQRFTSKNGDVKKSVELFTAVNNAILAGGASADIQSTALEQLSQAYAKGKPDMIEWRSLMTAMPAQLKQVAQAMGYVNTDELGEALRTGKVSMDDFMDAIVRLNKEGTGEFASFEEQAKNSVGGIGTSLKNMKTAVIRGVAKIVQSIDESLKNAGFGGISEIISRIGKTIEEALGKVAEFIKKIDWKGVIETIKKIIPVLGAVVAGFIAMQAIESVNNFITKTIQGVNGLGKAIQLLMAHPVIAIITAVIALLTILYQKSEDFRNAVNEMFTQIKNAVMSAWEKLKPSLEELWEALKELWEALQPV
jgi:tape measure domain-containing protein